MTIERDERFMGDRITDVETRLVESRNLRAVTRVEVFDKITRAEMELLTASFIHDLTAGHVRAGGAPVEGFTLLALTEVRR